MGTLLQIVSGPIIGPDDIVVGHDRRKIVKSGAEDLKRVLAGLAIISFALFTAGCQAKPEYIWAQESTVPLERINELLAPATYFDSHNDLNINEAENLGWNTDYIAKINNDLVQISYCEYFSPYLDDHFGEVTINLGTYVFSLDQIGGFQQEENGLRIICRDNNRCITNENKTYRSERGKEMIPGSRKKGERVLSEAHLYFLGVEKQRKVEERFQNLLVR